MLKIALLWLISLLLCAPPLTFLGGRLLLQVMPPDAPRLLLSSFLMAAFAVSAVCVMCRGVLARLARLTAVDLGQAVCICLFATAVALPRLLALDSHIPLAIYDDNWHLQKIVTLVATFPDLQHYLFPDLDFSYYFYAYIVPAAVYALKPGLNLKAVWAGYLAVVSGAMSLLLVMCFNLFLPELKRMRRLFALAITFMGGLHEWPVIVAAWRAGQQNWHTEWWAAQLGLPLQVSSFYTSHVWAPQHVLGLGLFGVIYGMLYRMKRAGLAGLLVGMLLGIQAGFSVPVALLSTLYVALHVLAGMAGNPKRQACLAICCVPGLAATLLPVAGHFLDKEGTLFLCCNAALLPRYILFLAVEFGALLLLFGLYCQRVLRGQMGADGAGLANVLFVIAALAVLFCVQSRGFNVVYYRGLLPVQLVLCLAGACALSSLRPRLRLLAIALVCLQSVSFAPEMLAVAKRSADASALRLPEDVVRINQTAALAELISVPYHADVDGFMLNTYINNIFRMKDVARRFYCEGKIDSNNLVYLNNSGLQSLQATCRTAR